MRGLKGAIAAAAVLLLSLPLKGQDTVLPEINGEATAAFDPGWIAKYYSLDWSRRGDIAVRTVEQMPWSKVWRASSGRYALSLRANLLHWATLTPDVGIEWRFSRNFGVILGGAYANWTVAGYHIGLWEAVPEFRWYFAKSRRWYLGAMGRVGQYNYKFRDPGVQGDMICGGLTVGYQLRMTRALSLDIGAGAGYIRTRYEKYSDVGDVMLRQEAGDKGMWGLIHAGVTFVWKLF